MLGCSIDIGRNVQQRLLCSIFFCVDSNNCYFINGFRGVSKKVAVQFSYTFIFSDYTTDTKIKQIPNSTDINDRFRHKASQLMLGIKYSPFKK